MSGKPKTGDPFIAEKFAWLEQVAFNKNSKDRGDAVRISIAISKHLNRKTKDAYPSLALLAELLGTNEKTVRRGIDWLVKQGHLETKRGGKGHATRYTIKLHDRTELSNQAVPETDKIVPETGQNCPDEWTELSILSGQNCPTNPLSEPIEEPFEEPFDVKTNKKPLSKSQEFEEFWNNYPRKKAKAAGRKAYDKARQTGSREDILAGAMRYAAERSSEDPQFTKHPSTWLNQQCWTDEADVKPYKPTMAEVIRDALTGEEGGSRGRTIDLEANERREPEPTYQHRPATEFYETPTGIPALDEAFANEPEVLGMFKQLRPAARDLVMRTLNSKGADAARAIIAQRAAA